jgi:hypothetical protein
MGSATLTLKSEPAEPDQAVYPENTNTYLSKETNGTAFADDSRRHEPEESNKAASPDNANTRKKKPLVFWMSFFALTLMTFMVALDATALAVAVPLVARDLHATTLQGFWANLAFVLAAVVCQPIYTTVSNVFGRKWPLYSTFCWFCAGSIMLARAQSIDLLITGRVIQGIGTGGLDVLGDIILADMTTLKERPIYLAMFAIPIAAGSILGPLIGAGFSEYVSWRWLGWINLPISATSFALVLFFLRLKPIGLGFCEKIRRLDWIGIVAFSIGCTAFSLPLSWAGTMYPWASWRTFLPLVMGSLILVFVAFYEFGILSKAPSNSIFPRRIFANRTAKLTMLGSFLHGAVLYSGIFYLPLFFQSVHLDSPLRSAVVILPLCCTGVVFSILTGGAIKVTRKYCWCIVASWMFAALGCGLLALWNRGSSLGMKIGVQVIIGMGADPFFASLPLAIQATVHDVNDAGLAVGILASFRLFGGLVSLPICSTLFSSVFENRIAVLGCLTEPYTILGDVREAIGFIPTLRLLDQNDASMAGILDSYRDAIVAVFLLLAGFSALGLFTSLFMEEKTIENEELGRQQQI